MAAVIRLRRVGQIRFRSYTNVLDSTSAQRLAAGSVRIAEPLHRTGQARLLVEVLDQQTRARISVEETKGFYPIVLRQKRIRRTSDRRGNAHPGADRVDNERLRLRGDVGAT